MSPRDTSISSASTSVTDACRPACRRAPSRSGSRARRVAARRQHGHAIADGDRARLDAAQVAARLPGGRARDELHGEAQRPPARRRRRRPPSRGSPAASGRRTSGGGRRGRRPCRRRAPTSGRNAHRVDARRFGEGGEVGDDRAKTRSSIVDEVHLVDGDHEVRECRAGAASVAWRRVCVTMPCARVDQQDREIRGAGAGDHVARVLLVAGRVGDDELARARGEVAVRDVDRDALLALGGEAVGEQREVERLRRAAATCAATAASWSARIALVS